MKKIKLLLIFLLFSTIAIAQNASTNNWTGHVTLIKRSQLFVGTGLEIPNSPAPARIPRSRANPFAWF
jgi:hypothetical protein